MYYTSKKVTVQNFSLRRIPPASPNIYIYIYLKKFSVEFSRCPDDETGKAELNFRHIVIIYTVKGT
jgi:hypothetical protein